MSETTILSAHDYRQRVGVLLERRRLEQAADALGEALAAYPDDTELLYQSALLEHLRDDHAEAAQVLMRVLARDPEHLQSRYLLANCHEQLDQLPQAETVLLELLHDYPEYGLLYAKYAMLMYRTLHVDKAKALAREALRLDPDCEMALSANLIGDMIDGTANAEKNSLAELMRKHPEDILTARLLIVHLIEKGRYWSAKRIAIELLHARPDSKEFLTLVVELELLCHWTMLPLWPFNRWGIWGTLGFYGLTVLCFSVLRSVAPQASGYASYVILGYVAYSWLYPPILRRWLKRRAGL